MRVRLFGSNRKRGSPVDDLFQLIARMKLVPVIAIHDAADAGPLAEALIAGGLPCAEVTFRTDAAVEAIRAMSAVDKMIVGAGTVLNTEQARLAIEAGAQFIVSPGFNPEVVGYCVESGIPITPGVCTPTDIEAALYFNLEVLKFFPAEAFGGLGTLKAMSAPYGMVRFIPTGGINASNLKTYLEFPKVIACGGSWMVKSDLIKAGKFDEIERLTADAVAIAESVER